MTKQSYWQGWPFQKLGSNPGGPNSRKYNRDKKTLEQQQEVLKIILTHNPSLVYGDKGVRIEPNEMDLLFAKIHSNAKGNSLLIRHNFLVEGLDKGVRDLGWQLAAPDPMTIINRPKPIHTTKSFELLHSLNQVNDIYMQFLNTTSHLQDLDFNVPGYPEIKPENTSKYFLAGEILHSAIVNGGLLNKTWVTTLGESLKTAAVISTSETIHKMPDPLFWVKLTRTEKRGGLTYVEYRRWLPDALTSLLIIKWHKNEYTWPNFPADMSPQQSVNYLLNFFWTIIGIPTQNRPTVSEFYTAARANFGLTAPPFLCDYVVSLNLCPSLSDQAWERFHHGTSVRTHIKYQDNDSVLDASKKTFYYSQAKKNSAENTSEFPNQYKMYKELLKCLYHAGHRKKISNSEAVRNIDNFLTEKSSKLIPILYALCQWSREMLFHGGFGRSSKIKPRSMRTYLSAIAFDLIAKGYDMNIESEDSSAWIELYRSILDHEILSHNDLARKAKQIRQFHHFVEKIYGAPPLSISNNSGIKSSVNSNYINEAEYEAAKYIIDQSIHSQEMQTTQKLLLILGYRAGLRIEEAVKLTLGDLQDGTDVTELYSILLKKPELLIRVNRFRNLKTKKSMRRIPLHLFLNEEEITLLLDWKKKRTLNYVSSSCCNKLLFCRKNSDVIPLKEKDTTVPICKALRHITGDPTIHYHHLRHSFTNNILLKIISEDLTSGSNSGTSLREQMRLCKNHEPSGRLLTSISQLCGHLDPATTMSCYIHIGDYLVGLFLRLNPIKLSLKQQATILGLTSKQIKNYRNRYKLNKGDTLSSQILHIECKLLRNTLADPILSTMRSHFPKPPTVDEPVPTPNYPDPMDLYFIFKLHHLGNSTLKQLSAMSDYSGTDIKRWIAFATRLGTNPPASNKAEIKRKLVPERVKIKTTNGEISYVNQVPEHIMDQNPNIPGLCPAPPHIIDDRIESIVLFKQIVSLYEATPQLAVSGLNLYIRNPSRKTNRPYLKSATDAILYTEFLLKIGLTKNRIRINLFATPRKPITEQKTYWKKQLSLSSNSFAKTTSFNRQPKKSIFGNVEIWVVEQKRKSQRGMENKNPTLPANSIKFAFYMAAVYLGAKITSNSETVMATTA